MVNTTTIQPVLLQPLTELAKLISKILFLNFHAIAQNLHCLICPVASVFQHRYCLQDIFFIEIYSYGHLVFMVTFKIILLSTQMTLSVPNEVFRVERTKLDIYVFFIMVKIVVSS